MNLGALRGIVGHGEQRRRSAAHLVLQILDLLLQRRALLWLSALHRRFHFSHLLLILFRARLPFGLFLGSSARDIVAPNLREESLHPVIVALADRIELVIVAS